MNYQPFLFNYNIPADNHVAEWPDKFICVYAEYTHTSSNGDANACVRLVNPLLYQVSQIKDWKKAANEIEQIAQQHFQRLVDLDRRLQAEDTLRQINWVEGQDKIAS